MYSYRPNLIFVENQAKDLPFTQKILAKLPEVPVEYLEDVQSQKKTPIDGIKKNFTQGKKILLLKKYLGTPVKICPGFSNDVVCCNYHVLDFIENCPLECTYCILQAYHNHPQITFHVNVEEILQKMEHTLRARSNQRFRIGTGEHSDSIALDALFDINATLVQFFGKFPNCLLELKTKGDYVEPILNIEHNGRTVVSWSVNSEWITKQNELKTANLDQRISAAVKVVEAGYKVAFHFDPLIEHKNWREYYLNTVKKIHAHIPESHIAWLSMGTLRYIPKLKTIAEERFPKTNVFCGEFVDGDDGKKRYFRKIREELIQTVGGYLNQYFPNINPFLCMENKTVWEKTNYSVPSSHLELEEKIFRGAE